jgi:predicted outer membrane repeat protein
MAGAVLIDGGSPRFTGCAFDSCAGAFGAGAVWVKAGSAEFLDCTFTANVAVQPNSRGGALQVADGASAVVTGCVFRGNKTRNSGGAIASLGFTDVVDCVFFANEGEDGINSRGGAFFGDGFLESCVFRQNEAAEGGAIYLGGTGIFPPARSPVVTGCTIVQNLASIDGGGLVTDRSENTIDHTIVAFNNGGAGASDPDQATVECCDFFGNVPSNTSGINVGTGNNFSLDPRFCDLMSGDLRLSGSSPCLPANNSGCSATVGSEGAGCP